MLVGAIYIIISAFKVPFLHYNMGYTQLIWKVSQQPSELSNI